MEIYINNEEVICSQKMTIKEQLKNTNSVILNNIYPKSWEIDKDYVSRFYMPKDYSNCKIIDEKVNTQTTQDLINNISYIDNRYIGGSNHKMIYSQGSKSIYVRLEPNREYNVTVTYSQSSSIGLFEADTLNIGETANRLVLLSTGESTVTITPTKKYLIATNSWSGNPYVSISAITTETDDNLIFSGVIKNSGNINLNPRYPHYSTLQLLDYKTFLSEGDTLNYVLDKQNVSEAIKRVTENLDGFMVGKIQINDTEISPYNCNEKTPYDVFEYLAEISGAIWYTKAVSDDLVLINFYATDYLETADDIEYTTEYFRTNQIEDIKYSYSAKDYRNKQIILNDKATGKITQTEYLTYEGKDLQTIYPISSIVSIKSGTKIYSFATETAKNSGQMADFYFKYDSNRIEVSTTVGTGRTIEIIYYPIVISRQIAYNQDEIDRINETTGRNGIIARYEKRTDTNNEIALSQIAQSYLDYKGVPEITLTVKTYYKDLLEIGQRVFFNGPLNDLKTNYLVIEKEINMITTGNQQVLFYTYKLSSSFNDETAINFFDNQRRKLESNIAEGEFIQRYVDIPNETNIIFYDLEITNVEIPNDVLDGDLDVELVGG